MNYATENDLLFDDVTLLEKKLGAGALNITSVNANCDCANDPIRSTYEYVDPKKVTESAPATA
ncbi:hypothetical protein P1X15_04195 [Runella sp. MFBS21]|uniref:hypothetical protein n=1 Tax=Runella sp. MFBS21 TaxID=3034018 RepID=UPI0023F8E4FF|nr:hypothetical protein [Runella sp. MFBS21]MDF7816779.1 hypothetical protein [Runella sp. MFBS21]